MKKVSLQNPGEPALYTIVEASGGGSANEEEPKQSSFAGFLEVQNMRLFPASELGAIHNIYRTGTVGLKSMYGRMAEYVVEWKKNGIEPGGLDELQVAVAVGSGRGRR